MVPGHIHGAYRRERDHWAAASISAAILDLTNWTFVLIAFTVLFVTFVHVYLAIIGYYYHIYLTLSFNPHLEPVIISESDENKIKTT